MNVANRLLALALLVPFATSCKAKAPSTWTTANPNNGNANSVSDPSSVTLQMSPGYSCEAFVYQNDVWLRSYYLGAGNFDFRIGAGGVVAEFRDNKAANVSLFADAARPNDRTD